MNNLKFLILIIASALFMLTLASCGENQRTAARIPDGRYEAAAPVLLSSYYRAGRYGLDEPVLAGSQISITAIVVDGSDLTIERSNGWTTFMFRLTDGRLTYMDGGIITFHRDGNVYFFEPTFINGKLEYNGVEFQRVD